MRLGSRSLVNHTAKSEEETAWCKWLGFWGCKEESQGENIIKTEERYVCVRACVRATVTVKSSVKMHFQDPQKNPMRVLRASPSATCARLRSFRLRLLWTPAFTYCGRADATCMHFQKSRVHLPTNPHLYSRARTCVRMPQNRPHVCGPEKSWILTALAYTCTCILRFHIFFHTPSLPKPTIK